VIPLQQNNVKIVFAGGTGCYGCNVVFLCFCFDLRHPTERKKKCVASAAHGGGSGRYRIGRMEENANGVTTQPKSHTHGQIRRGRTTAVAGVVGWPGVGAG
jgi:hypothetical protein